MINIEANKNLTETEYDPFLQTRGVQELLGNPKKALIKISVPVILSLLFQSAYNIVDTLWVSGLGEEALAAVGLSFPFYMIVFGVAMGIGTGASAGISRAIGARNRKRASDIATHGAVLSVILSVFALFMIPFMDRIYELMGADVSLAGVAGDYMKIFLGASILVFISAVGNSILRGEGDTKRSMYAIALGTFLNIILDPFFIYDFGFGWGVNGAAYASILSMAVSCSLILYWMLFEKKTFVQIKFKKFRMKHDILKEIFVIGIPASFSQFTMSIAMILLNSVVLMIGGTEGASVFTTGWRIVSIGIMPIIGLGTGLTALIGVSYGQRDIQKLKQVYNYAIKVGIAADILIGALMFLSAEPIAFIFTAFNNSQQLYDGLTIFLKIMFFFYLLIPVSILTSSVFQGIGLGKMSLFIIVIRSICEIPFAYILGLIMGYGLMGVWIGMLMGDLLIAIISYWIGKRTVNGMLRKYSQNI